MLRQKLGDYSFQICIHVVNSVNRANRTATLRFSDVRGLFNKEDRFVFVLFCAFQSVLFTTKQRIDDRRRL